MKKRNLLTLVVAKECIYICPIQKDLDLSPVEDMAEVISVVCYKELLGTPDATYTSLFADCRRLLRGTLPVINRCY